MVETYLREGACGIDEPSGCRSFVLIISSLMDSERVVSNQLDVVSAPAGSDQQDSDGSDSDEVGSDECGSDDGSSSLASWRSMTESVSGSGSSYDCPFDPYGEWADKRANGGASAYESDWDLTSNSSSCDSEESDAADDGADDVTVPPSDVSGDVYQYFARPILGGYDSDLMFSPSDVKRVPTLVKLSEDACNERRKHSCSWRLLAPHFLHAVRTEPRTTLDFEGVERIFQASHNNTQF